MGQVAMEVPISLENTGTTRVATTPGIEVVGSKPPLPGSPSSIELALTEARTDTPHIRGPSRSEGPAAVAAAAVAASEGKSREPRGPTIAACSLKDEPLYKSKAANFLPAMCVCTVWLWVVTRSHGPLDADAYAAAHNSSFIARPLGTLWDELFEEYYPMTIAMIAGSLIAGSTPLGGGVVAFPVAVLVIGFKPSEGRDFTVLIQSVGMNAAAYLIALRKSHLLDCDLVSNFFLCGVLGVIVGLTLDLPPFYVVLTFQVIVVEFAVVFFYLNVLAPREPVTFSTVSQGDAAPAKKKVTRTRLCLAYGAMSVAAFLGGFITANVGSGSDIMLYAYGLLVWNMIVPEEMRFSEMTLTASSIVVMGLLSLATSMCRAFTVQITNNVLFCWGATAWLVCWGAPLGSLLLTPAMRAQLRIAFYILAILQFIGFAVLKIKDKADAWIIFAATSVLILVLLGVHAAISRKKLVAKGMLPEALSCAVVKARLFK